MHRADGIKCKADDLEQQLASAPCHAWSTSCVGCRCQCIRPHLARSVDAGQCVGSIPCSNQTFSLPHLGTCSCLSVGCSVITSHNVKFSRAQSGTSEGKNLVFVTRWQGARHRDSVTNKQTKHKHVGHSTTVDNFREINVYSWSVRTWPIIRLTD